MAIASITAWLKDPVKHYPTGVALYNQYGTSVLLKSLFKKGPSSYHEARLLAALEELNEAVITEPLHVAVDVGMPAAAVVVFEGNRIVSPLPAKPILPELKDIPVSQVRHSLNDDEWSAAPDQVKDLFTENSRLKSRSDMAFHRIRVATSDADRRELAISRLNDNDAINQNWKAIKEYQASGKVTEKLQADSVKSVDQLKISELIAVLKNYPTYITKANKAIRDMQPGSQKYNDALLELKSKTIYLEAAKRRAENE